MQGVSFIKYVANTFRKHDLPCIIKHIFKMLFLAVYTLVVTQNYFSSPFRFTNVFITFCTYNEEFKNSNYFLT